MHGTSRKGPINYLQKAYRNFSDVIIKQEQKLTRQRTDKQEMKIFVSKWKSNEAAGCRGKA